MIAVCADNTPARIDASSWRFASGEPESTHASAAASVSLLHHRLRIVLTAISLATSPAAWPPMPSQTRNTPRSASK